MLNYTEGRGALIAHTIEDFMALDLTGVGTTAHIHEALRRRQPGPACMMGAELLAKHAGEGKGPVMIVTGFPEGAGIPETDGPVGAALLARALFLGLGAASVIVVDEDWLEMMVGTCRGAGLSPLPFPEDGVIRAPDAIRPVFIRTVPKDAEGCRAVTDDLLERTAPSILVSVERPGKNDHGVYSGLGGRPLEGLVADLDQAFAAAKERGIPTMAIGDGGNELGMGLLAEDVREINPMARDTGVEGRGGVAAVTVVDHVIFSNVSNWGATGLIAALSAYLGKPAVFHLPSLEVRCIEQCAASGGVDGMTMGPEPAVDGIRSEEWFGLVTALRNTLDRLNGNVIGWKGDSGDWRSLG